MGIVYWFELRSICSIRAVVIAQVRSMTPGSILSNVSAF